MILYTHEWRYPDPLIPHIWPQALWILHHKTLQPCTAISMAALMVIIMWLCPINLLLEWLLILIKNPVYSPCLQATAWHLHASVPKRSIYLERPDTIWRARCSFLKGPNRIWSKEIRYELLRLNNINEDAFLQTILAHELRHWCDCGFCRSARTSDQFSVSLTSTTINRRIIFWLEHRTFMKKAKRAKCWCTNCSRFGSTFNYGTEMIKQ